MLQRTANSPAAPATTRPRAAPSERKSESTRLFPTKNDLPEATRGRVADVLNQRLADCIDLQTQCKQAHWNVKGPTFIALHKLFDDINEDVEEYVDLLAERVVQLGGTAEGTARMVAGRSALDE
ncbi:MAG TPA: DNA starvation/stationary phase protection protein Dps, partial [Gemmatimonadales bacterium]|nr:DNA starvation/stationary phase protection protein Dps [Gemmatimonadales bacterium]